MCLITTIGYHGDRDWYGVSLNDTIELADPQNPVSRKQHVRIFNDAKVIAVQSFHRVYCNAIVGKIWKNVFFINETIKTTSRPPGRVI